MKVEVAVLGSPSLIVFWSVDVKKHCIGNKPTSELRTCVKVDVDLKQHLKKMANSK